MLAAATLLTQSAAAVGLTAAAIAVGGFLAHAGPALAGRSEEDLRRVTVVGGLWGMGMAALVILLSATVR